MHLSLAFSFTLYLFLVFSQPCFPPLSFFSSPLFSNTSVWHPLPAGWFFTGHQCNGGTGGKDKRRRGGCWGENNDKIYSQYGTVQNLALCMTNWWERWCAAWVLIYTGYGLDHSAWLTHWWWIDGGWLFKYKWCGSWYLHHFLMELWTQMSRLISSLRRTVRAIWTAFSLKAWILILLFIMISENIKFLAVNTQVRVACSPKKSYLYTNQ